MLLTSDQSARVPTIPAAVAATTSLSVIVPVRNDAARLKRCLEALARSTYRDFELIVADDASTDDTSAVAEAAGARVVRLAARSGSGAARNAGAAQARGDVLLFVDSDVLVHPDSLEIALRSFDDSGVDAVFGSYDLEPGELNLLSQYKNLAHRYYHQASRERASTFWTGCGAIRRDVFAASGGFDAQRFDRPAIEDIELGMRLTRAGRHIRINKRLEVRHLKRWSLGGIVRSDVCDRAIPWTRLILEVREVTTDLNLAPSQRVSAALCGVFVIAMLAACWWRPWLAAAPPVVFGVIALGDAWTTRRRVPAWAKAALGAFVLGAVAAVVWYADWWAAAVALPLLAVVSINAPFYRFFAGHRGWVFAAAVLPMHVLYYLYSAAVFALCTIAHRLRAPRQTR